MEWGLVHSVRAGRLDFVQYLCALRPSIIRQRAIEQAWDYALKSQELDMIQFLVREISIKALERSLLLVAQAGHLLILKECLKIYSPSIEMIHLVLRKAQSKNHSDVVLYLRGLAAILKHEKAAISALDYTGLSTMGLFSVNMDVAAQQVGVECANRLLG